MVKVGIVGNRKRNDLGDYHVVRDKFLELTYGTHLDSIIIISGGCPTGADMFADMLSRRYSIPLITHKADWFHKGPTAGFIRNQKIARDSDILIACVSKERKGGTEDTVKKFVRLKGDKNLYLV